MARGKGKQNASSSTGHNRPATRQSTLLSHFQKTPSTGQGEEPTVEIAREQVAEGASTSSSLNADPLNGSLVLTHGSTPSESSSTSNRHPLREAHLPLTNAGQSHQPIASFPSLNTSPEITDVDLMSSPPTTHPSSPILVGDAGSTRGDPIVVETASPKRETIQAAKPKKRIPPSDFLPSLTTVHAKGHQTRFTAPPLSLPRIHTPPSPPYPIKAPTTLPNNLAESSVRVADVLGTLSPQHLQHPAISRFSDPTPFLTDMAIKQMDWSQRFRPRCANEVLGNEPQALYLREWLTALALHFESPDDPPKANGKGSQGTKKKRVLRAFDKKKTRKRRRLGSDDEDDSWIVDDKEVEQDQFIEEADDDMLLPARPGSALVEYSPDFSQWLTNSIMLCGPHGSGKTAAVYACAEELGWEVFEVYAGIGRRNGSAVEALIGDVGKNHLVKKKRMNTEPQPKALNAFDRLGKKPEPEETAFSQSLILLEEVDILFKEDVNFWPTMVNIIKECRRPIVFTCNDPSLIPQSDFPLQTVLEFEPCPTPLATSYLRILSAFSNHRNPIGINTAEKLYQQQSSGLWNGFDFPDEPLHPFSIIRRSPDLRKGIHDLQWLCFGAGFPEAQAPRPIDIIRVADLASFVDSMMNRDIYDSSWALSFDNEDRSDEEGGHTTLYLPTRPSERPGIHPYYTADEEMKQTVCPNVEAFSSLPYDRSAYQNQLLEAIQDILSISCPLMPRPALHLDYEPYIRIIVAADDYHEQRLKSGQEGPSTHRPRRLTRNSGATHVRTINLSSRQRRALDLTKLSDF